MAYFPNGTSGMVYMEKYCLRCLSWKQRKNEDAPGCPIWDAHLLSNYDKAVAAVLNHLIPMDKDGIYPQQCRMFDWNGEVQGQMTMEPI